MDSRRCLITTTNLVGRVSAYAEPGSVLEPLGEGTLLIQYGDGPLEILEWTAYFSRDESTP